MRIVLVQGLAGSPHWWRPLVAYLDDYEVRHVDPRDPLDAQPDDVLIGHSLGGMRAAQYAAVADVRELVLVAPVGLQRIRAFGLVGAIIRRSIRRSRATRSAGPARAAPPRRRGDAHARRRRRDPHADADRVGERDNLVPVRLAAEWHELVPGSRLEIVAGVRNVPMVEAPSVFAKVLLDFLRDE